jgi:PleD family two-component response regulator
MGGTKMLRTELLFLQGSVRDHRKSEADMPPKPVKVLFAEDEVLLRLMVTDVLRQAGFQVFEASNGHEGVSILKTMPVDVVITDLPDRRMAQKSDFHAER